MAEEINKGDRTNIKPKMVKRSSKSFTLTIQPGTIQKFNEIQLLKNSIDMANYTRNDILMQALDLLGDSIGYDALMKKYGDKMKGDISPTLGRKSKNGKVSRDI